MFIWIATGVGAYMWHRRRQTTKDYHQALRAIVMHLVEEKGKADLLDIARAVGGKIKESELKMAIRPLINTGRLEYDTATSTFRQPPYAEVTETPL